MTETLATLPARALAAGYEAGAFSPTDAMQAVIAQIDAWEPTLCALYACHPETALIEAAASTARWRRGTQLGPLDGIPATVKEMIPTRGTPTPNGSAATALVPAAEDAPPAARLREAGCIIFAKTTAPDYGMLSSGLSSFHKLARNPWNPAHNPGGSSAGAGAAAAAGYGPFHVGTDIGGSIRLPSAWCGLVGFKPSLGRVPIDPYYVGRCAGPMTRCVDDAAWMMQVLAQPDRRDATSLPHQAIDWHAPPLSPKNLRIGLLLEAGCGMRVEAPIADAVTAASALFAAAGAEIVKVAPVLTHDILDGIDGFWRARLCAEIGLLPEARRGKILPFIASWAAAGEKLTGPAAAAGFNRIFELKRNCAKLFDGLDALLSPTTPVVAFPAEFASPLNDPQKPFEHIGFTLPWNMSEQPAISLPCGFAPGGMPLGLQIITPRFEDQRALRLARWYEAARGPVAWPEAPGRA